MNEHKNQFITHDELLKDYERLAISRDRWMFLAIWVSVLHIIDGLIELFA